jgi:hypothetical protein
MIAIIATLVALLLPAVQRVRMAAARMSTVNNIKQLGLASHSFHDAKGFLPWPGLVASDSATPESGPWSYQILPFIEQQNVYNSIVASNSTTKNVTLKAFLCPGRNRPGFTPSGTTLAGWGTVGTSQNGAATDYALNTWLNNSDNATDGAGGLQAQANIKCTLTSITDGTSNTLLIGEKSLATWQYAGNGGSYDETLFSVNGGTNRNGSSVIKDITNASPTTSGRQWGSPFDIWPFGLCDGSVRTISFGINIGEGGGIGLRKPSDGIVPSQGF